MPRKSASELAIERRIAAHVRQQMTKRGLNLTAMAKRLGVGKGTLSRILSLTRGMDASFVASVHIRLGLSADVILDEDPPPQFFQLGPPSTATAIDPGGAPETAQARKPRP